MAEEVSPEALASAKEFTRKLGRLVGLSMGGPDGTTIGVELDRLEELFALDLDGLLRDRKKMEVMRERIEALTLDLQTVLGASADAAAFRVRKTVEWAYRQAPGWWAAHQLWETTGDRTRDECIDAILEEMQCD